MTPFSWLSPLIWLALAVSVIGALYGAHHTVYQRGYAAGKEEVASDYRQRDRLNAQAAQAAVARDTARGEQVGQALEVQRGSIDSFFNSLERQARDANKRSPPPKLATPSTAPGIALADDVCSATCRLPDERLRIWRAANAGAGAQGDAASEPDGTAAAAAAADGREPDRTGGEPPRGGAGLSPAAGAVLCAGSVCGAALP